MKKEITLKQAVKNNIYACKFLGSVSKTRAFHSVILSAVHYFDWLFCSAMFMRFVLNAIEQEKSFNEILYFIIAVSLIFIMETIYRIYVKTISNPVTDIKIYHNLYSKIYKKANSVELACYENADFYNKYTMAIDKADKRIIETAENIAKIVMSFAALIWAGYIMFSIDSFLVLFIAFPIIGNFIFGNLMNKLYYNRYVDSVKYQRRTEYVNRVMYLSDFAKEIRPTDVFSIIRRDYDSAVKGIEKVTDKYSGKGTVFSFLQTYFTYTLIFEGVLLYGSYQAICNQSMPFADLAVLTSVMSTVSWILIGFTESLMKTIENGTFVQNLRGFLEYEDKITDSENSLPVPERIESIEFRNVKFGYKKDSPVLNGLSFRIDGGCRGALVGINGAGKTTIVKLLLRLYDVDEGEILLNGVNIKNYKLSDYRKLFSCAFQDFKIFADSVSGNISMGRNLSDDEIHSAIVRAGAEGDVTVLKSGKSTVISSEFDSSGTTLSGGQQQKIAAARAFSKKSLIKIFDEPSSALDPIAEYNMFQSILNETVGYTTFFISHRLSSAKNSDVIYMLEKGKVIESGTHTELIKADGKYAEMYNAQAVNYLADTSYNEYSELMKGGVSV